MQAVAWVAVYWISASTTVLTREAIAFVYVGSACRSRKACVWKDWPYTSLEREIHILSCTDSWKPVTSFVLTFKKPRFINFKKRFINKPQFYLSILVFILINTPIYIDYKQSKELIPHYNKSIYPQRYKLTDFQDENLKDQTIHLHWSKLLILVSKGTTIL